MDEQGSQSHAKVFVGLGEAEPAQLQLLLCSLNLPRKLVDDAAEGGGQVFAQRYHNAPQHVVMENPKTDDMRRTGQLHFHRFGLDLIYR